MNNPSLRLPAEWEFDADILLAWPHPDTDWLYMLSEVQKCYIDIITHLTQFGIRVILLAPSRNIPQLANIPHQSLIIVEVPTDDTWTRDYGPISFIDNDGHWKVADFKFNGWGLKFPAKYDNLTTRFLVDNHIISAPCLSNLDFVLEGGGIESDGKGTILTTSRCQFSINRNGGIHNPSLIDSLKSRLHSRRILFIDHGYLIGDDTDSHIDTLARFAPGDSILYVGCDDPSDEQFSELQAMRDDLSRLRTAEGLPYNLIQLPLPEPIFDTDGNRLPATYANFLATSKAVFLPVYGQPQRDNLAEQILKIVFHLPIVTINCLPLIQQHGSLHCATMQLPKQILAI